MCTSAGVKDLTSRRINGYKGHRGDREVAGGVDGKMKSRQAKSFLTPVPTSYGCSRFAN